jgi:glyoxylase-like metal-dependent hydrolase (beta-lactamase superfamily II)
VVSHALNLISVTDDIFLISPPDHMWPNSANVYVITDDSGFSMIDVGCGKVGSLERLMDALSRLDLTFSDLHTLVLSHAHPDHMGAAGSLLDKCNPDVLIHKDDVEQARDPRRLNITFDIEFAQKNYGDIRDGDFKISDVLRFFVDFGCPMSSVEPKRAIGEGDSVELGRHKFEVIHTPGHSPGHISLYNEATGILYGGDLVGEVVAWYTPTSGGVTGYLESLKKMEEKKPKLILPSHGGVIKKPQEKIAEVRDRLLQRESKMIDILSEGSISFVDLVDRMFKSKMIRFFPGAGIAESHVQKLIRDGKARRDGEKISLI